MKELSIEEKAKAYDEALKVLRKYDGANIILSQSLKEEMFPELVENRDEKVKKSINRLIRYYHDVNFPTPEGFSRKDLLDWIEKQGEPKEHDVCDNCDQQGNCVSPCCVKLVEKNGEQKPVDKVEPKFKVGDIITNGILIGEIDEIHEWGYHAYFGDHYADVPDVENWHKWTIQDAKANAGYEGNADKKELKKIEQKSTIIPKFKVGDIIRHKEQGFTCKIIAVDTEYRLSGCNGNHLPFDSQDAYELVEQKPAEWSEEDEYLLDETIKHLEALIRITKKQGSAYSNEIQYYQRDIDWLKNKLKSLKDRVQPKQEWSEEDEDILNTIINHFKVDIGCTDEDDMVRWLKSLKDRVQPRQEWTKEDKERYKSCLQRLSTDNPEQPETINSKWFKEHVYSKPQSTWRPSDRQIEILKDFLFHIPIEVPEKVVLVSLYHDLLKLKE